VLLAFGARAGLLNCLWTKLADDYMIHSINFLFCLSMFVQYIYLLKWERILET
jgi:hypothetical protein